MSSTSPSRRLRIMMVGFRGFPEVQGGVERHVESLCPLLERLGCDVEAIVRSPYMPRERGNSWRGVRFRRIWAPRSRMFEAAVHTFFGVILAAMRRPDILHIQAIGPALWTPFARLLGVHVIFTHHGPDYDRQKWSAPAKCILRLGEALGVRFANNVIAISRTIADTVQTKYGRGAVLLPNGVNLPDLPTTDETLRELGLRSQRYVLMVSRLVPEKRHLDLIRAFTRAPLKDWKLVLVGAADHPDEYSAQVEQAARESNNVVLAGFRKGTQLAELYAHAALFVLPSSHEGLPIALLEALSYGVPVLASDIPANKEVGLPASHYFPLGDIDMLAHKLVQAVQLTDSPSDRSARRRWVVEKYSWDEIARGTLKVYRECLARK